MVGSGVKLIHPTKFKMHRETLNQETEYWFGNASGAMYNSDDSLMELNPGNFNSELHDWVERETRTPR